MGSGNKHGNVGNKQPLEISVAMQEHNGLGK